MVNKSYLQGKKEEKIDLVVMVMGEVIGWACRQMQSVWQDT